MSNLEKLSYLKRLIEKFNKIDHIRVKYIDAVVTKITLPNGKMIPCSNIPVVTKDNEIIISSELDMQILLIIQEDHLMVASKCKSLVPSGFLPGKQNILKVSDYKNEIEELFDIIRLNQINFIICRKYMEDTYGEEKNFPLLIQKPKASYIFSNFFAKGNYFYKYEHRNSEEYVARGLFIAEKDFGKEIKGFNEHFSMKNKIDLIVYEDDNSKISLHLDSHDICEKEKFGEEMGTLLGHLNSLNEKMKQFSNPQDAYLEYLSEIDGPKPKK